MHFTTAQSPINLALKSHKKHYKPVKGGEIKAHLINMCFYIKSH